MRKLIYIIMGIALIGNISCQTSKQNKPSGNSTKNKKNEAVNTSTNSNQPITDNYRFIVSFISKGAGKDSKLLETYTTFLTEYGKRNNLSISKEVITWGREGEKDFCFKLSELSSEKQIEFVNESKTILKDSELIIVTENSKSKNKNKLTK